MSENQNRRVSELAKYDAMTTEELEQILRLDADAPEGQESDTETLLDVMEVLANRKRNNGHIGNTAQEAYESFRKNYLPEVEENVIAPDREAKPKVRSLRWLRSLSAVAAVLVVVLLGSVTARAFGVDIWGAVAKWTQETFHLGGNSQTDDAPGIDDDLPYTSLQEALQKGNIDEPLAPAWIPDGYQLTDITIQETPLRNTYYAQYKSSEKELLITVRNYLNSNPQYIEQSEDFLEIYAVGNIEYYIFSNHERARVAWINGSYECSISGELTIEELKMMIDSIEKG